MPSKRKVLALLINQLLCSVVLAQHQGVIRGHVADSSGTPLPSSQVLLKHLPDTVTIKEANSRNDGSFVFTDIAPGSYIVTASLIGYENKTGGPYLINGVNMTATDSLVLARRAKLLDEVTVNKEMSVVEAGPGRIVINVDKNLTAGGGSVYDILRKTPGVSVTAEGGISLRGRKGVTVLMDGKELKLSSSDVSQLLQNTSSELVSRIELQTNPSSDNDAAGAGGIVNIILKKDQSMGTNGSLTLGSGYGENYKINSAVSLNHRSKWFNLYGSWTYNNNKRADRYTMLRFVETNARDAGFDIHNFDLKTFNNHNYKAGADVYITKDQVLGFMITGMHNHMASDEDNSTRISNFGITDSTIRTNSDETRTVSNNSYNFNYKGDFKSAGSVSADFDYLNYSRKSVENLSYFFYDRGMNFYRTPETLVNQTPSSIHITSFKLDYSSPASGEKVFKSGFKTSVVESDNVRDMGEENFLAGQDDKFHFREAIYAGYVNYSLTYKKGKAEGGLRGEYTRSSGVSVLEGNQKSNYFKVFPYINFLFDMNEAHQFSLSYGRRINRPDYDDLNPFRYFLDQYTYREGNPYLQPEYADLIELSDVFKKNLSVTFSYDYTRDYYLTITEQNDTTMVSKSIKRNLSFLRSWGAETNYTLKAGEWLNSTINFQGYYQKFDLGDGSGIKREGFYFSGATTNTLKFKKRFSGQLSFSWESPEVSGMYNFKSLYVLDAGMGYNLPDSKGSLRLSVNDIFNSDRSRYYTSLWNLNLSGEQKSETRVVKLIFTYRFGRKSVTAARTRSAGNDQESKRVSN